VPKECLAGFTTAGAAEGPNFETAGNGWTCFLQGVSGMCAFGNPACGSSTFRFFFDIRPVDMKAAGSGFADL
jgi:hypothetical protein